LLPFLAQDVIQTMKQSDIALGALPRLVGELVSDFADVFCDKAVAHWLEKDENLTSDELIARSEASKAHLRAAPMFVKSYKVQTSFRGYPESNHKYENGKSSRSRRRTFNRLA
jgi:hypothetical protein